MRKFNSGEGAIRCDGCGTRIAIGARVLCQDAAEVAGGAKHYCSKNCVGRPRRPMATVVEEYGGLALPEILRDLVATGQASGVQKARWTWAWPVGIHMVVVSFVPVEPAAPIAGGYPEARGFWRTSR